VVAPDLPGHGFTDAPHTAALSLPGMAHAVTEMLRAEKLAPALVAGHSAGAAILARMVLDGAIAPRGLIGLNAAIMPLGGAAAPVFAPLAKLLSRISLLPELFSWHVADENVVRKLLAGTGSTIEPEGVALYRRVMKNPRHAAAALAMMANWDLRPVRRELPRLALPMLLIVGENDRTIPPRDAGRMRDLVADAEVATLPGLGHLAHEERPAETAELMLGFARRIGVLGAAA
jgi:magnesium chelatase accessory protein